MASEGTIMRDTRPTQANLSGHKEVDGAQHAFWHTKPRPGYVPRLRTVGIETKGLVLRLSLYEPRLCVDP